MIQTGRLTLTIEPSRSSVLSSNLKTLLKGCTLIFQDGSLAREHLPLS